MAACLVRGRSPLIVWHCRRLAMVLVVCLLLLAPAQVGAAAPVQAVSHALPIKMLDLRVGLPHPAVYSIARDPFGFLWFGTLEGLARYDGHSFVVYQADPANPQGLASSQIDTLYTDRAGMLWIGTLASGLNRYDPYQEQFTHYRHNPNDPTSLSSNAVRAIHEDATGRFWIGTLGGGLNQFDPATGRFTHYRHNPNEPYSLSDDHVAAILDDGRGGLWLATMGGLNHFDPTTGRFTVYRHDPNDPTSLGGDQVTTLLRDHAGVLWLGIRDVGLFRYDAARNQFQGYRSDPAGLRSGNVIALVESSPGQIWVATYGGGLYHFEVAREQFTDFNRLAAAGNGLATNHLESLLLHPDGLLLVGTEDRGVGLIDLQPGPFTIYTARSDAHTLPDALWPGPIRATLQDLDGALWLGVANSGLIRFDRTQGVMTHYAHDPADPSSPVSNRPQAMLLDQRGGLWIGHNNGLDWFDRTTEQFVHYPIEPGNPFALSHGDIFDLYESRDGMIWIATRGGGLNRLDPATGRFTHYRHDPTEPTSTSSDYVGSIVEDQAGYVWLGHESTGLSRLDPATGRFTNYRHDPDDPQTPGSNSVLALYGDPDGVIWAATWSGGLNRIDPTTGLVTRYPPANGLLSSKLNGIQPDAAGFLWLTSNQGLIRFDPRTGQSVGYTAASAGLPLGGFALNGSSQTRSGEIILGGFDSLVTFFPSDVHPQAVVGPVVFTAVQLANQALIPGSATTLTTTINAANGLTLAYDDQVLSLEFTVLDYRAPEAARYRYRLLGFDSQWVEVDSTRRLVTYTNLNPGNYTFEVQAANGEGVWSTAIRRLPITVVPPWWQTWWFMLLTATALIGSVAGMVGWRLRSDKHQRRQLEAEVATRTAALAAANASLERQVQLERILIMSLDLDTLLGGILDQIDEVVPFSTGAIFTLEAQTLTLRALRSHLFVPPTTPLQLDLSQIVTLHSVLASGTTQTLRTVEIDRNVLNYIGTMLGQPIMAQAWLLVPLRVQERVIGLLVLAHAQRECYGEQETAQVEPFVSPVALALENDRLRQQAQRAAILEERSRVARELHDAVTQTLFSASLIAEAMPDALERDLERAAQGAHELRRLTADALAEMRALLIELRPKALTEVSLGRLVQLLAATWRNRTAIPINVIVERDCTLPPVVQLACYRITQEALNNAMKHAAASEVTVRVACTPAEVLLEIHDNGCGFDPTQVARGGLGLGILHERANELGAYLDLHSRPGVGTTVTLHWQAGKGV
ncbi:MAG: two-component regulator propeller domain-containing protein [Oscillochloridaceae bacterium umkhey_bin13]